MVRVLEFVNGNADRNADKEHTRLATPRTPRTLPLRILGEIATFRGSRETAAHFGKFPTGKAFGAIFLRAIFFRQPLNSLRLLTV